MQFTNRSWVEITAIWSEHSSVDERGKGIYINKTCNQMTVLVEQPRYICIDIDIDIEIEINY